MWIIHIQSLLYINNFIENMYTKFTMATNLQGGYN